MRQRTCHFLNAAGCAEALQGKKQYFFIHAPATDKGQNILTSVTYRF